MADSNSWNNYAEQNRRLGWSDTNDQDRDWHAQEQQRAAERARQERAHEERQRQEANRRRNNGW